MRLSLPAGHVCVVTSIHVTSVSHIPQPTGPQTQLRNAPQEKQAPPAIMSLSSEEEEDQFLPDGRLSLKDEDSNELSSTSYSDPSEEEADDDDDRFTSAPPTQSSHTAPPPHPSHQQPAHMLSFGPPYYGRPPTPLPPSPSLTSLLRPSRPTTPDASDDEHGLGNSAEPVPRASPKVPTYEYYGFVLYLFSSCCFLIYLLWSYLPSPFLHALGIHYYPDRWWSLAVPSFLVVLLAYIYVALALYNTEYLTLPLHSLETVVDDAGKIAVVDGRGRIVVSEERRRNLERERERAGRAAAGGGGHQRKQSGGGFGGGGFGLGREREIDWRECWNEGTDAVMDVPLAGVCEVLYGGLRME